MVRAQMRVGGCDSAGQDLFKFILNAIYGEKGKTAQAPKGKMGQFCPHSLTLLDFAPMPRPENLFLLFNPKTFNVPLPHRHCDLARELPPAHIESMDCLRARCVCLLALSRNYIIRM